MLCLLNLRIKGSKDTEINSRATPLSHRHYDPTSSPSTAQRRRDVFKAAGLVQDAFKTGKRGFRKLGEDRSKQRGLEDRRTDRMTSKEATTKGPSKHKRPGREAESPIESVEERVVHAKQLQNTGEVHVKGHSVTPPTPPP